MKFFLKLSLISILILSTYSCTNNIQDSSQPKNDEDGIFIYDQHCKSDAYQTDLFETSFSNIWIVKALDLDQSSNLDLENKRLTMTYTTGTLHIERVIKGQQVFNSNLESTRFIKEGGIISLADWERRLPDEQRNFYDKISKKLKKELYVKEWCSKDIEVKQGSTYLMFTNSYYPYNLVQIFGGLAFVEYNPDTNKVYNHLTKSWVELNSFIDHPFQ